MCRCRALAVNRGQIILASSAGTGRIGCSVRGLGRSRWRVSGERDVTRDLLRASFAIFTSAGPDGGMEDRAPLLRSELTAASFSAEPVAPAVPFLATSYRRP